MSEVPYTHHTASVNDTTIHYLTAGDRSNPAVVLLHGFTQTSHLWAKDVIPALAKRYFIIAPDLRAPIPVKFGGPWRTAPAATRQMRPGGAILGGGLWAPAKTAPMPKQSAAMSQICNSHVTLKRVMTNQPEKIVTASPPSESHSSG